jgi:hypothetical protein
MAHSDFVLIGEPETWAGAFNVARELLGEDRLGAVAIVSTGEYATGRYVATAMDDNPELLGSPEVKLDRLQEICPHLYETAKKFQLFHGRVVSGLANNWILAVVYSEG